ncbi:MAG: TolB family protein, partial [Vicinamibacteria bacterium]
EVVTPGAIALVSITTDGVHTLRFFAVDNAGNLETEQAVTISVDKTPPVITIASPTNGATYFINQNVLAGYSASDALSGVATLTGTVPNGSAIQTTPIGLHAFSVTATDVAGNGTSTGVAYTVIFPGNIDSANLGSHFAWGENVGWINFKPSHGPGVTVTDSAVIGFAWGENIGWIDLSPSEGGVFNDGAGNLSGFAYGENVGWISFSCQNTASCATVDYGVRIHPENGRFSGHAWAENVGWIRFLETAGPADGVTTSWRPVTATAMRRVSVDSSGNEGVGPQGSASPTISANGRFVAFQSRHTNLVPGDTNNTWDVFVHDRDVDADGVFDEPGGISTTRVSVSSAGTEGDFESRAPSISADGRFVAFSSVASNLVAGDTNGRFDVFVHDRDADGNGTFDEPGGIATTRASVNSSGTQGNFSSDDPRISANGRFVCFRSDANNLVAVDTNLTQDTFAHDRDADADGIFDEPGGISTTRVSVPNLADQGTLGNQADGSSDCRGISGDGRLVALLSGATNLVQGDDSGFQDLFVHDRQTGATTRVSMPNGGLGTEANNHTFSGAMSADGGSVGFGSSASNLVVGDMNSSQDVFVHDLDTGMTTRVSVDRDGNEGGSSSSFPSLSADGRFVAFESFAENLVSDDTNSTGDIFVHDRQSRTTTRVSLPNPADQIPLGDEANGFSQSAAMSADGRFVAFSSFANNLVLGDSNAPDAEQDVFVHDRGN